MLFTGEDNGTVVKRADLLLEKGLVKSIGDLFHLREQYKATDLQVVDMHGAWVTPGLGESIAFLPRVQRRLTSPQSIFTVIWASSARPSLMVRFCSL